jgi:hypothetical protein
MMAKVTTPKTMKELNSMLSERRVNTQLRPAMKAVISRKRMVFRTCMAGAL